MTERKEQTFNSVLSGIKQYVCRVLPLTAKEKAALKKRIINTLAK